ncbi:hypothetical protein C8Q77DRAFT_111768 [Trametes polyzona]|nr:hypothetical protein C8Q77DRAFT_111768 [Trametes polyzona]
MPKNNCSPSDRLSGFLCRISNRRRLCFLSARTSSRGRLPRRLFQSGAPRIPPSAALHPTPITNAASWACEANALLPTQWPVRRLARTRTPPQALPDGRRAVGRARHRGVRSRRLSDCRTTEEVDGGGSVFSRQDVEERSIFCRQSQSLKAAPAFLACGPSPGRATRSNATAAAKRRVAPSISLWVGPIHRSTLGGSSRTGRACCVPRDTGKAKTHVLCPGSN